MRIKEIAIYVVVALFVLVVLMLIKPAEQTDYPLMVVVILASAVFMAGVQFLVNRFPIIQTMIAWFRYIFLVFGCVIGVVSFISFMPEDPIVGVFALLFVAGFFFIGLHKIPWILWGSFLFHRGWYGMAESHYSNLMRINPKLVVAYEQRALMRAKQNKFDDALADLNKGVELASQDVLQPQEPSQVIINRNNYFHMLNNRGNFHLMAIYNPDEAFNDFNRILTELDLDNLTPLDISVIRANRGVSQLHRGNYNEALHDLEATKLILSDHLALNTVLFNLALTYQGLGQFDEAKQYWREVLEKEPNFKNRQWLEQGWTKFSDTVWALWEQLAR